MPKGMHGLKTKTKNSYLVQRIIKNWDNLSFGQQICLVSSIFHTPSSITGSYTTQKHTSVIMALEAAHIFWRRKYRMGCLAYRTAGLFILQVLHWTVGKYLTHLFHPTIVVTLHWKTRNFQEKKLGKFLVLWASTQRRKKSNSVPLPLFSKLKSKII